MIHQYGLPIYSHCTYKLAKVVLAEVLWWLILTNDFFHCRVFFNVALEKVQRRIISIKQSILNVFLQGDLEFATRITLANFKQGVSKSFHQTLEKERHIHCLNYESIREFELTLSYHSCIPGQVSVTPVMMQGRLAFSYRSMNSSTVMSLMWTLSIVSVKEAGSSILSTSFCLHQ